RYGSCRPGSVPSSTWRISSAGERVLVMVTVWHPNGKVALNATIFPGISPRPGPRVSPFRGTGRLRRPRYGPPDDIGAGAGRRAVLRGLQTRSGVRGRPGRHAVRRAGDPPPVRVRRPAPPPPRPRALPVGDRPVPAPGASDARLPRGHRPDDRRLAAGEGQPLLPAAAAAAARPSR